ncbi:MAG: hypothetical protein AB1797_05770 [bacterium]
MKEKAVFLIRSPYWQIAETLKQRYGWEIFGFSVHPMWMLPNYMREFCSGYLDLHSVVEKAKTSPVPDDIIAKSKYLEEKYNLNLADIISPDRHLGIGWVTGGLYHPGRLSFMPYEKHLHIIFDVFQSVSDFLQQVNPTFVSPGIVGGFEGAIVYSVCHKNQIPIYSLNLLSYGSYYYWQQERFGHIPYLEEIYNKSKSASSQINDSEIDDIAPFTRSIIPEMERKGTYYDLIKKLSRTFYKHARIKIAKSKQSGEVYLSTQLKYSIDNFLNFRKEMRRKYLPESELSKLDYIYLPLHYEPEASLNAVEPYFANQMYAVELLSRSVPAGVYVLVKEHPGAIGNRPSYWMDTIAGFPRVKLIHPFVNSIKIIKKSMATATITGTPGLEAAILGKPVISLGPCYRFNFVDHVYFANDLISLRKLIKWIDEEKDSLDFTKNGAILKRAIEMTCFKIDKYFFVTEPSDSDIELACSELLKLLNEEGSNYSTTKTLSHEEELTQAEIV